MKPITKVLVANRGEIAVRILRTCRDMGLATVAVFSDADAGAPFVRAADEAVRIGPPPAADSYLAMDRLIGAATRTGADAIHPGYGFLAENAAFAEAVESAGLVFVGPTPASIRAMGSKTEAKALMSAAGVPVIPGYAGPEQDTPSLARRAREVGFPLLVKASAGGGGKGMRLVRADVRLEDEIDAARREAEKAFGDGTLLIERYIDHPRHVEIQILGDAHGNLVHLFERECSIQRRHQKIIEETPSVALTPELRAQMGEVARKAGQAIGYRGAGTVELILAPDRSFYFLEVNTRLQVEHPVTECITGLDLVHEQLRVAQGEPLGYGQDDVTMRGAAVECRIYAEDPESGYLPSTGTLVDWHIPPLAGLRVDSGVETGSMVGIHYDPMLAKVITHGPTRAEATRRMIRALSTLSVQGVTTNRELLLDVLRHPAYLDGDIDTHFLETHLPAWKRTVAPETERRAAIAAAVADCLQRDETRRVLPTLVSGYRNIKDRPQAASFSVGDSTVDVTYDRLARHSFRVHASGAAADALVVSWEPPRLVLEVDGLRQAVRVVRAGDTVYVHGPDGSTRLTERPRFPDAAHEGTDAGCKAPMPGKILEVRVRVGQPLRKGDVVVTLEAMKMEHSVLAPDDAVVAAILVKEGEQVEAFAPLVELEPPEPGPAAEPPV